MKTKKKVGRPVWWKVVPHPIIPKRLHRLGWYTAIVAAALAAILLPPRSASAVPPGARRSLAAPERGAGSDARLRRAIDKVLAQPGTSQAYWGLQVVDQATGRVLYQRDADHYFTPASNAKLFTTALALSTLTPNYRWRTTLETAGQIDSAGTLQGDLVLVGRGDPNLSNRVFPFGEKVQAQGPPEVVLDELIDQAIAHGLKRVTGNVVADDTYFTYERYPPGWNVDDMTADYGAPVSALVLDDNTLEIDVTPGPTDGAPVTFRAVPWSAFYKIRSEAITAAAGADNTLELGREPDSLDVTITGQIPAGAQPAQLYLAVEQPARFDAALLEHLLEQRGIQVTGQPLVAHQFADQPPPSVPARQVLAEHDSPSLAETVRYLLKVSQNLHAECLLRTVAHEKTGIGSRKNGLNVEQQFLNTLGIEKDAVFFDGSGLSRYDEVTPSGVVTLLRWAAQQTWVSIYQDALPVAGRDGTLADRMQDSPAQGRIIAKTGSLFHDHSLSGYATTLAGRHLVFSMLVNNVPPGMKILPYMDQVAEAIVEDRAPQPRRERPAKRAQRRN